MTRFPTLLLPILLACAPSQRSAIAPTALELVGSEALALSVPPVAADPGMVAFGREASRFPIVLLGENGHGVREHTMMKVAMVRHLHERHGFDVIAFESSYHDCREAEERIGTESAAATLRRCLLTQLHHAELVPLFEYIVATHRTDRPLRIAGIDLQVQSYYGRSRPQYFRQGLGALGSALADTIAVLDSIFIEKSYTPADTLRAWLYPHLEATRQLFNSALAITSGDLQWSLRSMTEILRRETVRSALLARGAPNTAEIYQIRDEYMARSVLREADLGGSHPRKVMVWLHNDHARYDNWANGDLAIKSTGQYLRELAPGRTYSVGFLMGGGTVANNSRRPMQVAQAGSGSLEWHFKQTGLGAAWLSLGASAAVREWAGREYAYARGNEVLRIVPGAAFDALVYVDSVGVPGYRIP